MNMTSTSDGTLGSAIEARPAPAGAVTSEARDGSAPPQADEGAHTDPRAGQPATDAPLQRRPLRPGLRRTGGEDGCCGRGPRPPWRSQDISWSPRWRRR